MLGQRRHCFPASAERERQGELFPIDRVGDTTFKYQNMRNRNNPFHGGTKPTAGPFQYCCAVAAEPVLVTIEWSALFCAATLSATATVVLRALLYNSILCNCYISLSACRLVFEPPVAVLGDAQEASSGWWVQQGVRPHGEAGPLGLRRWRCEWNNVGWRTYHASSFGLSKRPLGNPKNGTTV